MSRGGLRVRRRAPTIPDEFLPRLHEIMALGHSRAAVARGLKVSVDSIRLALKRPYKKAETPDAQTQ